MNDNLRDTNLVIYGTITRGSIESSRHGAIDVSLKDLRNVSRRVVAFSTPYSNELQLLERIYYKGKNQQRSALFWHKIPDIRRLGTRIKDMNIHDTVEEMRCAFYAKEDRSNTKSLRSAWKQTPDGSTCVSLLKRSKSACLLIDQARARFRSAYEAFIRQIRTGSFIPLAISLISITSRLDFLVSELREILLMQWQAVARILENITLTEVNAYRNALLPPDPFSLPMLTTALGSGAIRPEYPRKKSKLSGDRMITEDMGSMVSRDPNSMLTSSHTVSRTFSGQHSLDGLPLSASYYNAHAVYPDTSRMSFQVADVPATTSRLTGSPRFHSEPERGVENKSQKATKTKKASRKRDEIDEIFGF